MMFVCSMKTDWQKEIVECPFLEVRWSESLLVLFPICPAMSPMSPYSATYLFAHIRSWAAFSWCLNSDHLLHFLDKKNLEFPIQLSFFFIKIYGKFCDYSIPSDHCHIRSPRLPVFVPVLTFPTVSPACDLALVWHSLSVTGQSVQDNSVSL